jgi:isopenicillin N synthase-like dioxygenase
MAEALTEIPKVDLDDFEAGGRRQRLFEELAMRAYHDIGFMFVKAPEEVTRNLPALYKASEKFFDLPEEEKVKLEQKHNHHQRGWTPPNYELGLACRGIGPDGDDVRNSAENLFYGPWDDELANNPIAKRYPAFYPPNVWPEQVPELEAAVRPVYEGLYKTGRYILRSLTKPLGVEPEFFDNMLHNGPTVIRPLHYAAESEEKIKEEGIIGACWHTDINLNTVLPGSTRSGLLVKARNGLVIPGMAPEGYMISQVGDMLQRITAGHFLSAQHMVKAPIAVNENDKGRYSVAEFLHPASDVMLNILPRFDTPENREKFPPITAEAYLLQRLTEIGLAGTADDLK